MVRSLRIALSSAALMPLFCTAWYRKRIGSGQEFFTERYEIFFSGIFPATLQGWSRPAPRAAPSARRCRAWTDMPCRIAPR